jgi:hypothetical protein
MQTLDANVRSEGPDEGLGTIMTIRRPRCRHPLTTGFVALGLALPAAGGPASPEELLRFGAQMARSGNWREARFRWEQALRHDAGDPRLLNNLAIAEEALGAPDRARELYAQAAAAGGGDSRIRDNQMRSALFWGKSTDAVGEDPKAPAARAEWSKKRGRDVVEVPVSLPLPPRLKLDDAKTVLVASFLANDSSLLDVNRELVRFLRAEFRKHTPFEIQNVMPPPAVPEQTLDDMAKNSEFFTWLGREHHSDVIVTGAMRYTRRDASGFEDVDLVSEITGQKIRQSQFVEREEFTFELDVLYFRGADGSLLFRDHLRRQAIFRGASNDPISAFYELGSSIAGDVLSVIASRTRTDSRLLFKG